MTFTTRCLVPALACLVVAAAVAPLRAQTTFTFNNRTLFNAATTNQSTITYDGGGYTYSGTPNSTANQGPYDDGSSMGTVRFTNPTSPAASGSLFVGPLTLGGITYTPGTGRNIEIIDGSNAGSPNNTLLTPYGASGTGTAFTLTLSSAPTAFGFDIKDTFETTFGPNLGNYQVFLNGSATPTAAIATPGKNMFLFLGFVSDTPINTVTVQILAGGDPGIDNVTTATANLPLVPEPGSVALTVFGALGVLIGIKRRRQRA